ncbi:MAG TPA: hypothetical protein VE174_02025 [Actinomycetota bacterium]|nr:hypothetical protein [Actinomycetota bacterium]
MNKADISGFQEDLKRIPGIRGARVIGDDAPTEIHIIATGDKPAKQVVRDVQSLAAAAYDLTIDHRIVSIVETSDNGSNGHEVEPRVVLNWLMMASQGDSSRIDVGLKWPTGETAGGAPAPSANRETRARAAAEAVAAALESTLKERNATVEVDSVVLPRIGSTDAVLVKALFREKGAVTVLLGSALIEDDVASAAARALLDACNRKLAR